jgi:hypothetical protein
MQSAFQEIFGGRSAQYIWEAMVVNKSFWYQHCPDINKQSFP